MTPAARLQAAIEVLTAILDDRRPAADALKGWGQAHRFAGSGDRAAIGGLVFDALRRKASSAYLMGAETPRAVLIGMLKRERGLDADAIGKLASGGQYAPEALSDDERARLETTSLDGASAHVIGDYPEWLDDSFAQSFGDKRAEEGAALSSRAPLDLRVNTLKGEREKAAGQLADLKPELTPWSPCGLRITLGAEAKAPPVHAEPAFIKGLVEVQDEGSQLAALFSGAAAGEQVLDLCAGAGGKTLALAAMMANKGQLFATDDDKRRLAPIHDRLTRSGARNVQVRTPKSIGGEIDDLKGRMDMVLIDAPCTGTGAWRRNPDAKWRMRPGALEQRVKEQADILDRAVDFVKTTGRIVYITCSLLEAENGAQVRGFLGRHPGFAVEPPATTIKRLGAAAAGFAKAARLGPEGILMTPKSTGTDGFFVAVLRRS
ncbi:MFS transporter [Pseudolabrys sp. Root1462]|uniref:RsmB/NOP family class I SAM-dependent RNA methyltransferase n=1 Tax=Pseudolabrys sp. Root1462 TaxID=1736466 RepID=UPI000702BF71|nr:RsmB/NOP family class I SAM-dependent RNA methyltransferase [Pseudolabrys sp. Root1462]KQZ01350.1 MFS transporter [Pseudolabrys sp. Root1462]